MVHTERMDSYNVALRTNSDNDNNWCGRPKEVTVYLCQVILLYIVIITCIINLSVDNGKSNLWTALLSSCLGYMLPNPSLRKKIDANRFSVRGQEGGGTDHSEDVIDGAE